MNGPLTIGLLIDDSLDRPDGVQQYVLTLGAWLTSQGHNVHYLTSTPFRGKKRVLQPGAASPPSASLGDPPAGIDRAHFHPIGRTLTVKFNGNRLGTPLPVSRAAAREVIDQLGLDILHVTLPHSPFFAGRMIDAATDAGVPVVGAFVIYPEGPVVELGGRFLGGLERRRLAKFSEFTSISEAAAEFAQRAFGVKSVITGAPVDTAEFAAACQAAGQPNSRPPVRIVYLGRLVERKDSEHLVAALGELHLRHPELNWQAEIAGKGPLLAQLEQLAEETGIADRVVFPGFVAEADKAALLASADLVVLPSTGGESFGISVVEALAASTGVVLAGDNPGYRTVMRGLESQLFDPTDHQQFADLLADWASEVSKPEIRRAIGEQQQQAAARFDVTPVGQAIEAIYQKALADP